MEPLDHLNGSLVYCRSTFTFHARFHDGHLSPISAPFLALVRPRRQTPSFLPQPVHDISPTTLEVQCGRSLSAIQVLLSRSHSGSHMAMAGGIGGIYASLDAVPGAEHCTVLQSDRSSPARCLGLKAPSESTYPVSTSKPILPFPCTMRLPIPAYVSIFPSPDFRLSCPICVRRGRASRWWG